MVGEHLLGRVFLSPEVSGGIALKWGWAAVDLFELGKHAFRLSAQNDQLDLRCEPCEARFET